MQPDKRCYIYRPAIAKEERGSHQQQPGSGLDDSLNALARPVMLPPWQVQTRPCCQDERKSHKLKVGSDGSVLDLVMIAQASTASRYTRAGLFARCTEGSLVDVQAVPRQPRSIIRSTGGVMSPAMSSLDTALRLTKGKHSAHNVTAPRCKFL